MHGTLHDDMKENNMHDMHGAQSTSQAGVLRALTEEFGLASRVAVDLVAKHDLEYLERHIEYARYARAAGIVKRNSPGWLVASIRDNWSPPKGYPDGGDGGSSAPAQRWYTDEEYEQFFLHPGEGVGSRE
jgi:hypothetical protein